MLYNILFVFTGGISLVFLYVMIVLIVAMSRENELPDLEDVEA